MSMADFSDCIQTFEQTKAALADVEDRLAKQLRLSRRIPVRRVLVALDDACELDDSPLVAEWRATYARFLEWAQPEDDWEYREAPRVAARPEKTTEAATAASALLCLLRSDQFGRLALEWPSRKSSDGRSTAFFPA